MTREFEVIPSVVPSWTGITPAGRVVAEFLSEVRVTGDPEAAARLMAPTVLCHQVESDEPRTIVRSPAEYASHVQDMLRAFGRFRYTVTELLAEGDRVYVRWRQTGHDVAGTGRPVTEVGSAVYRVSGTSIAEYWIQLDRLGLQRQLTSVQARR